MRSGKNRERRRRSLPMKLRVPCFQPRVDHQRFSLASPHRSAGSAPDTRLLSSLSCPTGRSTAYQLGIEESFLRVPNFDDACGDKEHRDATVAPPIRPGFSTRSADSDTSNPAGFRNVSPRGRETRPISDFLILGRLAIFLSPTTPYDFRCDESRGPVNSGVPQ